MSALWRDQEITSTLTIKAAGGDGVTSSRVSNQNFVLAGILVPAGFEGTTVSFNVALAVTGASSPLYDDQGNQVLLPVAAGRAYALPAALAPWPYFELVSNNAVAQDRAFALVKKG